MAPHGSRVLVEQLRLLHANASISTLATGLVALIVAWALREGPRPGLLAAWCAMVLAMITACVLFARRVARDPDLAAHASATARASMVLYGAYGALWGALAWIVLDGADPYVLSMVAFVFAGMTAGGMTFMTPVLPVFLWYCGLQVALFGLRLAFLGDAGAAVMTTFAVIYVVTVSMQASRASRTFREMIELRFANADLAEKLGEESARAQAANLAKSRFLAAASHDLRQPAHALGLLLDVLGRSGLSPHQATVHRNLVGAAQATRDMLDTLLDFSRIEAGVLQPSVRRFRLQELLARVEHALAVEADAKGLIYRTHETTLAAESDPALVELVLRNLVSNAVRYTARGGVLVGARRRGGMAVLEVWDTGVGIPRDKHAEVFREFHQLGNPERDRAKGLGLGLAISEGIARTLGHTLTLGSTPGRGSVFRLALPLAEAPTGEPAPRALPESFDACVLVIDDDDAAREALHALVVSWGARCNAVESIDQALAASARERPDLVITDYRLREERTGGEAVAALRDWLGEPLPAIIVTGDTAPERLREAAAADATLLHKPVAPERLRAAIAELLEARERP